MTVSNRIHPLVVDLSHHNTIAKNGFEQAYTWGIRGVIHKATESTSYKDQNYLKNRKAAQAAGMLWAAYHFFRPSDVKKQVDFFLKTVKPDGDTMLALDHEDSKCTVRDVTEFLGMIEKAVGRKAILYSGHLIKDQLDGMKNSYLGSHRLWLAQYGTRPVVQASWNNWWLWQYTGDGLGPNPNDIPGLGNNIDVNSYDGTVEDLTREWKNAKVSPDTSSV